MKNITKKTVVGKVDEAEEEAALPEVKDVSYIEGFNPMFQHWDQAEIEIAYALLTGESTEAIDDDALIELTDKFTTELELRSDLKEWRLWKKNFPEGIRYLLQQLRLDSTRPYYLTQKVFIGKQKALKALHDARKENESEEESEE